MEELVGNLAFGVMSLRKQEDLENTKESLRHESAELLFKNTLLEAQLESTIDGILVVDENEKIILFNKRFGEVLSISQNILDFKDDKKLIEYSIDDLKDPESFFEVMEYLKAHKNEKSRDQFEFKDGRIFDRYSSPLLSESGNYYGRVWYIRDITELMKVEKALKDSEERMRLTLEATHIGLWDWDVKNDEWYASDIYYSMLGYEPQSGPGDRAKWLERVHPDDRDMVKEKIDNVLVQNFNSYEYEARLRHADGTYRWVHVAGFGIERDPDGRATRMLGIRVDITERKKAEDAILQAKEEWEHTFDAVPDLIAILDTEYHVIRANKAMADRLGVSPEEAVGVTCYEVVHGLTAPPSFCPYYKLLKDGQEHAVEVHEDRIGGDFIVSVSPLYDSEGKLMGSVHVARDITGRKKAEDEVKKSLEEKEALLSEIHHRVKNNMQIISSLLNLQTQFVTSDETVKVLHESQDRVKAMATIYEKLYLSEDLTKINFKNYIQSLVQGLFYSHTTKKGQIEPIIKIEDIMLNIETAVPCGLIISELVSNSLKHAFPDDEEGEIQVSLQRCDGKYELLISDNGIGFPEDINFKNTNTLGLQLVNNLIDQIDGEITLNRSHGTEFKITFKELKYVKRI
ncbi:PAS domain S-box protein [Methanobacterium ferruginis]|uniref:PAS domain S-box protein n=1 Tax=Methanobacterium ferruginis TaxID=710191 RepID=UPI002574784B|nr:PAS domain S-box protein [Methanobacterium ferruginis]BDZ69213.1 hypothetical protein GCM10025860_26610 [Methanobacterium ferruginis]